MRRFRFITLIILSFVVLLFAIIAFLAVSGPVIGNVFSNITNGLENGDDATVTALSTQALVTTAIVSSTQIADATQNALGTPSDLASETAIPATLTTQEFATQIANLATVQALPTPESVVVASSDDSIAGNGDVISYYNTELAYPNTMPISLEVIFRELAIQPTPLSEQLIREINRDIPLPNIVEADIQEEPPPARNTENITDIPLSVIAELDCLETSFVGCEEQTSRTLNLEGINRWTWTVQPVEGISGNQNLTLRLISAEDDRTILYEHNFTIQVRSNALWVVLQNNLGVFALAISLVFVGLISAVAMRSGQKTVKSTGISVFISYKRHGSWGIAEKIHDGLTSRGVDAFIDSKDLHEGDFEARLTNEINQRDYVVVVLVAETLSSEWVVKEIAYAFEQGKTVIPLLIEGIKMETLEIPPEIAELNKQNAVSIYQKYFDAGIDELMTFLKPIQ